MVRLDLILPRYYAQQTGNTSSRFPWPAPAMLGILLSMVILGTVYGQTTKFFSQTTSTRPPPIITRLFVLLLVGSESFKSVLDVANLYIVVGRVFLELMHIFGKLTGTFKLSLQFISHAGRPQSDIVMTTTVKIESIMTIVPIICAQCWLLHRVYSVSCYTNRRMTLRSDL